MASKHHEVKLRQSLDELLECAIDRGADFGTFVEVDSRHSTLADALGGEFKFLCIALALLTTPSNIVLSIHTL